MNVPGFPQISECARMHCKDSVATFNRRYPETAASVTMWSHPSLGAGSGHPISLACQDLMSPSGQAIQPVCLELQSKVLGPPIYQRFTCREILKLCGQHHHGRCKYICVLCNGPCLHCKHFGSQSWGSVVLGGNMSWRLGSSCGMHAAPVVPAGSSRAGMFLKMQPARC